MGSSLWADDLINDWELGKPAALTHNNITTSQRKILAQDLAKAPGKKTTACMHDTYEFEINI